MHEDSTTLRWRPLTGGDAKASADLLNAIETVDEIGENYTEEDSLQELIDPYADLEHASLAAFDGDVMVGYMKIRHKPSAEEVHRVFLDGGVHPDHRRRGIGTALVEAGVVAAKVVHAKHHPALRLVVDVHKSERIAGLAELVRSQGFEPVRYFQRMEHPLGDAVPGTAIPDGLRVEPWSERNDEEFRSVRNSSFEDYGTLRAHRKRGIAGSLIGHALRAAADQGYDRASLSVDSASPSGASGVFEKAGFTPKMRYVRWALEV